MDRIILPKNPTFKINQKNNRFILKLYGNPNHEYMNIEKDDTLILSKIRIDNFEKKGQISKWQFNLDRIYTQDTTFDELFENEIENNDFLNDFSTKSLYRTLIFIGDRNDSLTEIPYKDFILKCLRECLNGIEKNENSIDIKNRDSLIPIISFCELNKSFIVDYLKKNDNTNIDNNIDSSVLMNPKLKLYEDDVLIDGLSQIKISDENEFNSLLNIAKKNIENTKLNDMNGLKKDESISQILTLKLLKTNTNKCYSKINFVLYKAYEILDEEGNSNCYSNKMYNLYTRDNYNFFNGVQNKIDYRLSYIIKYLRDTLVKGNNLFIAILPVEYQYLLLMHDLLDNIRMRKLIVENIDLNDESDESNYQLGEIYRFENISELNPDDGSFQSFSKNNSIMTNISSAFDIKCKNFLGNSYFENKLTEGKNKRKEINYERLRKIDNKNDIIKLFDIFDQLSLEDLELYE